MENNEIGDDECRSLMTPYIEKVKAKKKAEKEANYYILHKKSPKNLDYGEPGEFFQNLKFLSLSCNKLTSRSA